MKGNEMLQIEIITVKSFKIKTGLTTSYIGQQLCITKTTGIYIIMQSCCFYQKTLNERHKFLKNLTKCKSYTSNYGIYLQI
jgi:hypothetical protein